MLHYIVSLALLAYGAMADNMNNVTSKYIIYPFGSGQQITFFPFAIITDYCQPGSIGTSSLKFACAVDGTTVTVNRYSSADCSGSAATSTINKTYTGINSVNFPAIPYAFSCTGDDEYVQINFNIGSSTCDASSVNAHIRAALNRCTRVPVSATVNRYLRVYCSDEYAELQYYASTDSTCTGTQVGKYTANETCGYMFPFATGVDIWGDVESCTQGTPATTMGSSPAMMFNGIIALLIAIIGALLC